MMKAYGLELTEEMANEGYVLGIGPQGIVIGAQSPRGQLYGTVTLRQMTRRRRTRRVAAGGGGVRDWPKMTLRDIDDEISYGEVSTMDNFKDMIASCSTSK